MARRPRSGDSATHGRIFKQYSDLTATEAVVPNVKEKAIQNLILEWLNLQPRCMAWQNDTVGIWDPKLKIYRSRKAKFYAKGPADILGIWRSRPLAIETKSATGRLTPEQQHFLTDFEANGGIAIVARSLDDVISRLTPSSPVQPGSVPSVPSQGG